MNKMPLHDKVMIFQTALEHEAAANSNARSLIVTFETFLFGLFLTFSELQLHNRLWIIAAVALIVGVPLGIAAEYRLRNVDFWRKSIVNLLHGTEIEPVFSQGRYLWNPFPISWIQRLTQLIFGHWFEHILLLLIFLFWALILGIYPSPLIVRIVVIFVIIGYIVYTFEIISL